MPAKPEFLRSKGSRRPYYRRRFSLAEVRWGFAVLALLALIASWVTWRGAHPDPELFATPLASTSRGPLPSDLADAGWREGSVSTFDAEHLFEKIDGRADYYKSFGFKRLYCVSLTQGDSTAIDIELYDLGRPANALGAYAGERPAEVDAKLDVSGLAHLARNALMLTQGRFYLRAIGSDESPSVISQLRRLEQVFRQALPAEPLPWGYALFVGQLGLEPSKVSYLAENAFSFGFARDVYLAHLGKGTTTLFLVATANDAAASALAARFSDGFAGLGEQAKPIGDVRITADPFLGSLSGATAHQRWVVGVYRATDREVAQQS